MSLVLSLSKDDVNKLLLINTIGWELMLHIKLKGDEYKSHED
jgi:hypothetical protein